MKSALELLKKRVLSWQLDEPDESQNISSRMGTIRVTYQTILDVYEAKHGSKIAGTLRS